MACHNGEAFVADAIESVQRQTFRNYEIVVVDDGSTDNSAAIVSSYVRSNIMLLRQKKSGAAAARNAAFRRSRGEFVIFLDADDLFAPTHLESLVECATRHPDCIALSRWDRFRTTPAEARFPERITQGDYEGATWLELDWRDAQPMTQSGMLLLPRRMLDEYGLWDERLSLDDDFEFFARMISKSRGIRFTPGGALYYRSAIRGSLSGQKSAAAAQSAYLSLDMGTKHLLAAKNTANTRRVCANLFQAFDYRFFPQHGELRTQARNRVAELGGADLLPDGPPGFQRLRPWIGWRAARLTQIAAQKAGLNRAARKKA